MSLYPQSESAARPTVKIGICSSHFRDNAGSSRASRGPTSLCTHPPEHIFRKEHEWRNDHKQGGDQRARFSEIAPPIPDHPNRCNAEHGRRNARRKVTHAKKEVRKCDPMELPGSMHHGCMLITLSTI